jgi:hypothetical protein
MNATKAINDLGYLLAFADFLSNTAELIRGELVLLSNMIGSYYYSSYVDDTGSISIIFKNNDKELEVYFDLGTFSYYTNGGGREYIVKFNRNDSDRDYGEESLFLRKDVCAYYAKWLLEN